MTDSNSQRREDDGLPNASAWADMLARIGEKHARLSRAVKAMPAEGRAIASNRTSLVHEIEKERARIARELHAGAGQPLAGIKITLESLESWAREMPEETRQALARLNRLAEAALGQVRAVSHRLHPPEWQERSLDEALRLLVKESGVETVCQTSVDLDPLPLEPSHSARVVLYRCAQECISNVLRHSAATLFSLTLSESDGIVNLRISDNGQGLPGDVLQRGGIGLASIREHTRSAGGILKISSSSEGTTIQVSLPLTEE